MPLYPGERGPSTHSIGGWVGPSAGLETDERRKISCPFLGIEPKFLGCQPLARRYTDRAIPAPKHEWKLIIT
jgi:hypothetical protein